MHVVGADEALTRSEPLTATVRPEGAPVTA
jgi:hypothetical protein